MVAPSKIGPVIYRANLWHLIPDEDPADDEQEPEIEIPNAADPVQIAAREKTQKRNRGEGAEFWAKVFADKVGRREMWNILDQAKTFENRFATGPNGFPQPEATWFYAGETAFGQRLFQSWLLIEPEGVTAMLNENDPRWAKPKRARNKRDDG